MEAGEAGSGPVGLHGLKEKRRRVVWVALVLLLQDSQPWQWFSVSSGDESEGRKIVTGPEAAILTVTTLAKVSTFLILWLDQLLTIFQAAHHLMTEGHIVQQADMVGHGDENVHVSGVMNLFDAFSGYYGHQRDGIEGQLLVIEAYNWYRSDHL